MVVPEDKLGDFILTTGEFNLYEEFAGDPADFCTVNQNASSTPGPRDVDLLADNAHSSSNRNAFVRSTIYYGRLHPIGRMVFHLVRALGDFRSSISGETTVSGSPGPDFRMTPGATLLVRPVLFDFATDALTWDSAYPGSYGNAAEIPIVTPDNSELRLDISMNGGSQVVGEASMIMRIGGPFVVGPTQVTDAGWNDLDKIFGFELSLSITENSESMQWQADLSDLNSLCYTILA